MYKQLVLLALKKPLVYNRINPFNEGSFANGRNYSDSSLCF